MNTCCQYDKITLRDVDEQLRDEVHVYAQHPETEPTALCEGRESQLILHHSSINVYLFFLFFIFAFLANEHILGFI